MIDTSQAGTPESVWEKALSDLPPLSWPSLPRRVLVIAPHPDDETLGVGGLMAAASCEGREVTVLLLTDGENSHPGVPGLADRRIGELQEALSALAGGRTIEVIRAGLPDGGLRAIPGAIEQAIRSTVRADDWCLATYQMDGHPDHEATGSSMAAVVSEMPSVRCGWFPIWAWHAAQPARLLLDSAARLDLAPEARRRKQLAIARFRSQQEGVDPILPPHVLARFDRGFEVVFE